MTFRRRARCLAGLALVAAVLGSAAPVTAQPDTVPIQEVDIEDHPTVRVDFSAPPTFVDGELVAEEVTVLENGEPRIFEIEVTSADNLEVVLVIDTSGSMNNNNALAEAKLAVESFVERVPGGTRIAVVGFGDTPSVVSEFTTDRGAVVDAVNELQARGETALYDGVLEALRLFDPSVDAPRYVVLVSDGGDTVSEAAVGNAQAAVQATGIPVVAVSLVTNESDPEALDALTGDAGGTVVEADDPVALAGLYDQIATAITVQYRLTYQSEAADRTLIEIRLKRGDDAASGSVAVDMPVPPAPTPAPTPTAEPTPTPESTPQEPTPAIIVTPRDRSWLLPVGIILVGVALLVLFNFLLWPARRRRNLLRELAPGAGNIAKAGGGVLGGVARTLVRGVERVVTSRDEEGELAQRLDRAGVRMRPAEYLVVTVLAAIVAALVGLFASVAAAVLLAILTVVGSLVVLGIIGDRRAADFEAQMATTLQMMSGALRAGFSISQVVDLVAREASSPTRDEFARLSAEESLGRDISDSFRDVAARMKSEDFAWVAEAIDINRSVGGDLSEVLENVSQTIRTRQAIQREIRTLSAEGRLSAAILIAVPFIIFTGQFFINRDLTRELTNTGEGRVLIAVGLVMITAGSLWMRRIVRLKY